MSISNYLTTCGPLSGPLPHCPREWWNKAQCFIIGSRSVWWKLWKGEEAHVKLLQLVLLHHLNRLPSLRNRICIHTGQDIFMPFQTPDLSHRKIIWQKNIHFFSSHPFIGVRCPVLSYLKPESVWTYAVRALHCFMVFSVDYFWKVMPCYNFLLKSVNFHQLNCFCTIIVPILYFNQRFGWQLVVLGAKLILAPQGMSKWIWPSMKWFRNLCSNLHTNSKHAPKTYRTWKVLYPKQPTPNQSFDWYKG